MSDYLRRAYAAALNSPDPSTQVGAIAVTADGYITGVGWNHIPASSGIDHATVDRETKYRCVVHAEVHALITSRDLVHTLFGTWAACPQCAASMIAAGVQRLVVHDAPRKLAETTNPGWTEAVAEGHRMLRAAHVDIVEHTGPIDAEPILIGGHLLVPSC